MLLMQAIPRSTLSDSSHARHANREVLLLLIRIAACDSVHLVFAIVPGHGSLLRVADLELQLENVLVFCGVDVGVVALGVHLALALDVVFVFEATRALELRVVLEAEVEAVVAAGCAAEDELVHEELALVAGVGGRSGGGEASSSESEDSRGVHICCGWVGLRLFSGLELVVGV
jgi:hypothetical protein